MVVRPLRGRVMVRESFDDGYTGPVILLQHGREDRNRKTHRGTVLAVGDPALYNGVEQPMGIEVGDVVVFAFGVATEKARTVSIDEEHIVFVAQEELLAVIEPPAPFPDVETVTVDGVEYRRVESIDYRK